MGEVSTTLVAQQFRIAKWWPLTLKPPRLGKTGEIIMTFTILDDRVKQQLEIITNHLGAFDVRIPSLDD
jgi:hypothetical protein